MAAYADIQFSAQHISACPNDRARQGGRGMEDCDQWNGGEIVLEWRESVGSGFSIVALSRKD